MPEVDPQLLANLDSESRKEIAQWLDAESSKSKVQSSIHNFTDMCWKQCVTGPINSNVLDKQEEQCMANCLHRFLDTNINIVKWIQEGAR